ncbi:MAG: hypothetical protein ACM31G_07050 [Flavobacteriales bacterium]
MNLNLLYALCAEQKQNALDDFKHYMTNALFPLDRNIFDIEISHMKQSMGQKINKKMFEAFTLTVPQIKVMENITISYQKDAVKEAVNFCKHLNP